MKSLIILIVSVKYIKMTEFKELHEKYLDVVSAVYGDSETYRDKAEMIRLKQNDILDYQLKRGDLKGLQIEDFDEKMVRDLEYILRLGPEKAIDKIREGEIRKGEGKKQEREVMKGRHDVSGLPWCEITECSRSD